jgi:hypothetical protein
MDKASHRLQSRPSLRLILVGRLFRLVNRAQLGIADGLGEHVTQLSL